MIHGCFLHKLYVYLSCAGSHRGGQVDGVNEVPYLPYSPISHQTFSYQNLLENYEKETQTSSYQLRSKYFLIPYELLSE